VALAAKEDPETLSEERRGFVSATGYPMTYRLLCLKDGVVLKLRYPGGETVEAGMTDAEAEQLLRDLTAAVRDRKRSEGVIGARPREPEKPCAGFQWIGQSFASCDRCGKPYWEHTHEERLPEGARLFGSKPMELVPISPERAALCKRKWGTS
jgi:hypothetical protein